MSLIQVLPLLALLCGAEARAADAVPAAAPDGVPADLRLWPVTPVPAVDFPAEAGSALPTAPLPAPDPAALTPDRLDADLQAELWKDIPVIPPEAPAPAPVAELPPPVPPRFYLGVGVLADQLGRFATDPTGRGSLLSSAYPALIGSAVFPIEPFWKLSFWALDTPFRKSTLDGGESTIVVMAGARALRVFRLAEGWTVEPLVGAGLMLYQVIGAGGTIQLNNGNGVTTFGFPSDSSSATLFFLEAGVAISLWRFRWESSLLGTGVATSRRSFSFLSTLSFGIL